MIYLYFNDLEIIILYVYIAILIKTIALWVNIVCGFNNNNNRIVTQPNPHNSANILHNRNCFTVLFVIHISDRRHGTFGCVNNRNGVDLSHI